MKSYAYCGASHRAIRLEIETPKECKDKWQLAGLWDMDQRRIDEFKRVFPQYQNLGYYLGSDLFENMLRELRPDLLIICNRDCFHADYAIRALKMDINVLIEKPMVVNSEQCRMLLEAEKNSNASVTVAFNYRYEPMHQKIKQLVDDACIGTVTAVQMNVYLDEIHGSSFFQRWNRLRKNSGGLTIHKEGHYIDLINWWINQEPDEVFGYADLKYYGPNAELNPSRKEGRYCGNCSEADKCLYEQTRIRKHSADNHIKGVQGDLHKLGNRHSNQNKYTNYRPDMCIFDSEIDIEDTYASVIRYKNGAFLNFSVNFSSPIESYHLVINGTRGRLEAGYGFEPAYENPYACGGLVLYPLFSTQPETIHVPPAKGGHGGGDPLLMQTMFDSSPETEYIKATALQGAQAVCIGEAMWRSAKEHRPITINELLT